MNLATQHDGVTPLRMVHKPPYSIPSPTKSTSLDETVSYRHVKATDGPLSVPACSPHVTTVYEVLASSAEKFPDHHAVGSRRLLRMHHETRQLPKSTGGSKTSTAKQWSLPELSGYSYLTYRDFRRRALQMGAGLRKIGLKPGDVLHIFASTSANWFAMSHAAASQSIAIATAYDSLGASAVEHTLTQPGCVAMFLDLHLLGNATTGLETVKSVKHCVYNDQNNTPIPEGVLQTFRQTHPHLGIISLTELLELGESHPCDPVPPKPDDLFCIMYTSGSSGAPKGVPVMHETMVAALAGLLCNLEEGYHQERILAYLPLAHILELCTENLVLLDGGTLGYGSPRTLFDSMTKNCLGDVREFRPTVLVGVPQVWETLRKGIETRISASGLVTRLAFWSAFRLKSFVVSAGLPGTGLIDDIIFSKIREMTGGDVRFLFSGASSISHHTQHFLSLVLAPMITGYGLTETVGNGAMGNPLQWTTDSIGPVSGALEMKLVSVPDLGYDATSNPPQGEIWCRGKTVVKEYYKNPEETAKAFTEDGWFRTGDVGEIDAHGRVKVIDRVKNLVKLQGGEYIALEKLEATYRASRFVNNLMVYGSSEHRRPIAIIMPATDVISDLAARLGVSEDEKLRSPKIVAAVHEDLLAMAKRSGLQSLETVAGVLLVEDEWLPASGLVTPTFKLKRNALEAMYKADIARTYTAVERVLGAKL